QSDGASPHARSPERLDGGDVANERRPERPRVRTLETRRDDVHFVRVAADEGAEELSRVAIRDDETGREHEFRETVEMHIADDVAETEHAAQSDAEHEHHRDTRIDRARDEERRKNRRVPTRQESLREIERDRKS